MQTDIYKYGDDVNIRITNYVYPIGLSYAYS